jgi:hypothetical protein
VLQEHTSACLVGGHTVHESNGGSDGERKFTVFEIYRAAVPPKWRRAANAGSVPFNLHGNRSPLGLVRLFLIHMDWMRLEKILKKFDLFGI